MRLIILVTFFLASGNAFAQKPQPIQLSSDELNNKVDVLVDGQLFTSYIFSGQLKKPVLWPVISAGGNEVTRSFPLKNKAGERVDHPHHVGIWLNYGDVNGLDFWNNSNVISPERRKHSGTISHQKIQEIASGKEGLLKVTANWNDDSGKTLLEEMSEFAFRADEGIRVIERTTKLTAKVDKVTFTDNKEGMFAIRVARELELPTNKPIKLADSEGNVVRRDNPDNSIVTGNYLSSQGITGKEVWSTRAKWMKLSGEINGESVSIVIFDHADNVGYPTHWHARSYGLFAANNLGQKIFSKGKIELNFELEKGESVTFKYKVVVFSTNPSKTEIEQFSTF